MTSKLSTYHGKSWLSILGDSSKNIGKEIFASHTFHEIKCTTYWVIRDQKFKLIWNIAHPLPYPFASDLWAASSFQAQYRESMSAPYGQKTVRDYIHRPEFEFFQIEQDPYESKNLADNSNYSSLLKSYR